MPSPYSQQKIKSAPIFCCHILNLLALFVLVVPAVVLYPYAIKKRRVVCTVKQVLGPKEILQSLGKTFSNDTSEVYQYPVYIEVEWETPRGDTSRGNLMRCLDTMKYHKYEKIEQCLKKMRGIFKLGKKLDCAVPDERRRLFADSNSNAFTKDTLHRFLHHQFTLTAVPHLASPMPPSEQATISVPLQSEPGQAFPRLPSSTASPLRNTSQFRLQRAILAHSDPLLRSTHNDTIRNPHVHEYNEWLDTRYSICIFLLKLAGVVSAACIVIDLIFLGTCFGGELFKVYVLESKCLRRYIFQKRNRSLADVQHQLYNESHYTIEYDNDSVCTAKSKNDPSKQLLCDYSKQRVKIKLRARQILANTAPLLKEKILYEHRFSLHDALKAVPTWIVWTRTLITIFIMVCILCGGIAAIFYLSIYYKLWSIAFVIPVCMVLCSMTFTYFLEVCIVPYKNMVLWVTDNRRVILLSSGCLDIFNIDQMEHIYTRDELLDDPPCVLERINRSHHGESIVCRSVGGMDVLVCVGISGYAEWQTLYKQIYKQFRSYHRENHRNSEQRRVGTHGDTEYYYYTTSSTSEDMDWFLHLHGYDVDSRSIGDIPRATIR